MVGAMAAHSSTAAGCTRHGAGRLAPRAMPRPFTPSLSPCTPPLGAGLIAQSRRVQDPIIPPYIQLSPQQGDAIDLYGYMLQNRIIMVGKRVNDAVATQVVASLLALDSINPNEEIRLYINAGAGSPYAITGILDTIRAMQAPVSTIGVGMVGGAVAVLLAGGAKGRRFIMANSRVMLQQPNGGAMGSADEVNIQATELNRTMQLMYTFLAEYTGLPMDKVEEECDREHFLGAEESKELGIVDGIIGTPPAFMPRNGLLQFARGNF
uniref:ATP-dependent Clp protease proteolytic subunit n=1 Tax=Auxenochlorella protothecoides TaxID=3075 RepID=A0A1D1ZRH7_AUXPR